MNSVIPGLEQAVLRKVTLRLIPLMFLLYIVAYLDRINISFAGLQIQKDLGISDKDFGFCSGVFFLGYFLFEVPSNLIMERTGARVWIARIMATWGLISAAMMFVNGPISLSVLRFLLGVAEAGFFPGMILYLTYWFPRAERARAVAWFMTATSVSGVVGSPISGFLLDMNGVGGLYGWQWLFLIEGLPAIALGFVVLYCLTDRPEQADWLSDEERDWLVQRIKEEEHERAARHGVSFLLALRNRRVWLITSVYFCMTICFYGYGFFMPKIIKDSGTVSDAQVGWLTAIPNLVSVFAMVLVGRSSDRTGERRWHLAGSAVVGSVGLLLTAYFRHSTVLVVASMSLALAGMRSALGPFWALPTAFLAGTAAAGGIATINSVGNLGGYVGPYVFGTLMDSFEGSHAPGLIFLVGCQFLAAVLALCVPREEKGDVPSDS